MAITLETPPHSNPAAAPSGVTPSAISSGPRDHDGARSGERDAAGRSTERRERPARGRVGRNESTFLLAQLSLVLETGTPLALGLRQIASQGEPRMRIVAEALLADLETGSTFTRALSHQPGLFSPGEISMIQVGETGGFMGEMMNRVVALRERSDRLKGVVRGAMAYPAILLVVATSVIIFMLGFIFPKFQDVFDDMDTPLPLSTRMLIGLSTVLRHDGIWILAGLAVLSGAAVWWARSARGRRVVERAALALPAVGPLLRSITLSHLFRNLGSLLQAKVPLLSALETTKGSLRLAAFRDLMDDVAAAAERGEGAAASIARSPLVPALARSIILTGEETGRADQVFLRLSSYYDEQVEKRVKTLTTLLEPVLLIGMGGIVSFVVISLVLPIFRMSRGVH